MIMKRISVCSDNTHSYRGQLGYSQKVNNRLKVIMRDVISTC